MSPKPTQAPHFGSFAQSTRSPILRFLSVLRDLPYRLQFVWGTADTSADPQFSIIRFGHVRTRSHTTHCSGTQIVSRRLTARETWETGVVMIDVTVAVRDSWVCLSQDESLCPPSPGSMIVSPNETAVCSSKSATPSNSSANSVRRSSCCRKIRSGETCAGSIGHFNKAGPTAKSWSYPPLRRTGR